MLEEVARRLEVWVIDQNVMARAEGLPTIHPFTIRVFGQTALIEARVPLTLAATQDIDVRADYTHVVEREFERLLRAEGRVLDPLGHEAWMPRETRYTQLFQGKWVRVALAEPDAVLISKALKAPLKNAPLITEYLAVGASERFLELATKYAIDLEQFL